MLRIINALWATAIGEDCTFELNDHTWCVKLNKKRTKVTLYGLNGKVATIRTAGHTMFDLATAIKKLCDKTIII